MKNLYNLVTPDVEVESRRSFFSFTAQPTSCPCARGDRCFLDAYLIRWEGARPSVLSDT